MNKNIEQMRRDQLVQQLGRHPELWERLEALLNVVEDSQGDLAKADAAELRVIEELRRMGQEALGAWAKRQAEKAGEAVSQAGAHRAGKKNSAGTRRSGK